ncbi:L-threonylcarbamoyladenylate synthase [Streptococcus sciuri]|uniref:L-threonylcarbamoyladenylate synthase n=1 Tax=Streptococcus sciuri TaxID=2973939 RepID=A0ABT2F5A3_9STRE|nr:L-threonylcarbamoyladenylate synthase [Streptococcus sciuri]MCS4487607.1 L-threonylcarbamoyladenylate synthase [Streptococcus sciuri]
MNSQLIAELKKKKAIVLPTETVYGLFAKAMEEEAVDYVYRLKKRPRDKAMNLNVSSFDEILAYSSQQPFFLRKLYDAFLPGALTIILRSNDKVPTWINSGYDTVGFRVPNHPKTLDIIRSEGPLIGPSANFSGKKSGTVFETIMTEFNHQVLGYEDDSVITGRDSTILDISQVKAKILRQGMITQEQLIKAVPELIFD